MSRKERLERLRKQLVEQRDEFRRRLSGDVGGAAGGNSGDEGDIATCNSADELDSRLASHMSDELAQIKAALEKFTAGRYGICEMTGVPIPIARLEALPFTRHSVEAQRLIEDEGYTADDFRSENGWARAVEHENRFSERDARMEELEEIED